MKTIRTKRSIILGICWMSLLWINVFCLSTTAYAGLQSGLIAHYPFDGNAADIGPYGYDGTENGALLTVDRFAAPDSAYFFDGDDDYISAGNFQLPAIFSIAMWINPQNTAGGQMFIGKQSAGTDPLIRVGFSAGGYSVGIGSVSYADGEKTTGWQHIAVVVEKTGTPHNRVLFYKNGRLLWSKNHFDPFEDTSALPIAMGASWSGASPVNFFAGEMDDVRIYNRTLSQTEIELLFDPTQGLDTSSDGDIDGKDLSIFSGSMGQIRWYKDWDGDGYSDGTSQWGSEQPDGYYTKEELAGISGDCDDSNYDINPTTTGPECPPFGACCYTVMEDCVLVVQCDDNVSEQTCTNELNGTFHQETLYCAELSAEDCAVGSGTGACCTLSESGAAVCNDNVTSSQCTSDGGNFFDRRLCSDLSIGECPFIPDPVGACCLSENTSSPVRCIEGRTQTQCTTLGGNWFEKQQCADLTIEQCPTLPDSTGACCQTMVSEDGTSASVCNDNVSITECTDNGGSFFADRLCSDLTSEECPTPTGVGACCHPKISYVNESGVFPVQCLNSLTEYKCKLLQGTWSEAQTCADLEAAEACAPYGACCYTDTATGTAKCANWMLESICDKLSGTFHANQKCDEVARECGLTPPVVSACCLTTADLATPVRCVDGRTEAQCTTLGGTWFDPDAEGWDEDGNGTVFCNELTFADCPSVAETSGACCVSFGSGSPATANCYDSTTLSDCTDAGGTLYANRLCSDLTTEECPTPAAVGSCCHPKISYVNESGVFPVQCLDSLTEYKCKLLQGKWNEAGVCADLTEEECAPFGACCYDDDNTAKCANWMLQTNCNKLSGTFHANQKCTEVEEECGLTAPAVGACCLTTAGSGDAISPIRCIDSRTEAQCTTLGGTWHGSETACADLTYADCPPIAETSGACCISYGSGSTATATCNDNVTNSNCTDAGGTLYANRLCSDLTSEECPTPAAVGSCCHPKISYVNESGVFPVQCLDSLTEYKCKLLQGAWTEAGVCADLNEEECAPFGACCYTDTATSTAKCANWMLQTNCNKLSGSFYPDQKCTEVEKECGLTAPAVGACCLTTSESGSAISPVRCIDSRTNAQCTTLGGTWSEDTLCMDLPFADCPPVAETSGACCVSFGSSATCNDNVTNSDCADAGGTLYANRLCSDLTAEECPVPAAVGSCCHPKISYVNESGVFPVQCLDSLTEYKCKLLQGKWTESGVCADLSETECPPYGACCYKDSEGTKCANWMLESDCSKFDEWKFDANMKCSEVECVTPPTVGACCLTATESGGAITPVRCIDARTEDQCTTLGGKWSPERACADLTYAECPAVAEPTGACCQTLLSKDGSSSYAACNDNVTGSDCADEGGSFFANRLCSGLTAAECPVPAPTGACCHPKISYVNESGVFPVQCLNDLTEYKCKILQGSWYEEKKCEEIEETGECLPYGACCYKDSQGTPQCANWMLETDCYKLEGTFYQNTQCSEEICDISTEPTGACCLSEIEGSTVRCVDARTQDQCTVLGGTWFKEGSTCEQIGDSCPYLR